MSSQETDPLVEQATVREQPFASSVPLLGAIIVAFRSAWNSVAARWYVRPIVEQQNRFNLELVEQLRRAEDRLLALDQQNAELTRQIAALTAQVRRLQADRMSDDDC